MNPKMIIDPDKPPLRLEYVAPDSLEDNPKNWRSHPEFQMDALKGLLAEAGWAGALLYNESTGRLIDGHARKELAIARKLPLIPVLIGSWSVQEEAKILAALDPIAALAEAMPVQLDAILREIDTGDEGMQMLMSKLAEEAKLIPKDCESGSDSEPEGGAEDDGPGDDEVFALKVMCQSERSRNDVRNWLKSQGITSVDM